MFIYITLIFCLFSLGVQGEDVKVLGCGGYIVSAVGIDYSHVTIKLLTQQGNEKYETECAPNNGYYFIPIYDKGDYIIKVFAPSGWTFQPNEFPIRIDGESDFCSIGKDINFQFGGFAVVGKVISKGSSDGPSGVSVSLSQNGKEILKTTTSEGGLYQFTPLAPGSYEVSAAHKSWTIKNNKVLVHVTDKNGDAGNALVVEGYQLAGSAAHFVKHTKDIFMVLHGVPNAASVIDCIPGAPKGYPNLIGTSVLCYVKANAKGEFMFKKLSPGSYVITPHFPSLPQFNISPLKVDVTIGHDDVSIGNVFKISGGTMVGHVRIKGVGVVGAKVVLNGRQNTLTDAQGQYQFIDVQFGSHVISVSADDVEFDDMKTSFSMQQLSVPVISPAKFKVCFSVHLDSASPIPSEPWKIVISQVGKPDQTMAVKSNSKQCVLLPPAAYQAKILNAKESTVRFSPDKHSFTVDSEAINNLSFAQFLAQINGVIDCLTDCPSLTVHLRSAKSAFKPQTLVSSHGQFMFRDVTPGEYVLSVDKEEWCWADQTLQVVVDEKKVSVKFVHKGYRLTINASHKIALSYTLKDAAGELAVPSGTSRHCMPLPGKYHFAHAGCHQFGSQDLSWDTASPQLLSLIATHHKITARLQSKEPASFSVVVNPASPNKLEVPLVASDKSTYLFEHWAVSGEQLVLQPHSASNLFQFTPTEYVVNMDNECLFDVVSFETQRALFLKGAIKPAVKGADILVFDGTTTETYPINAEGVFVVGPLDRSKPYTVRAQKSGFTIKPANYAFEPKDYAHDVIKAYFDAHKLAEINVLVLDETDAPLQGVLVSTSGGKNYRQNSLTDDQGTFVFESLMPNEYFVRPMMKEYVFEPASKMVQVLGGQTTNVVIKGSRVAFSVFGKTVTLNGQPEPEVVLEVVGVGEKCFNLQEETVTDTSGNFRIRGLVPQCEYVLKMKEGEGLNQHLARSIPDKKHVTMGTSDVTGVDLVLMRPFNQLDVAVTVRTDKKFLSTLTAELYRDSVPDSPVHVAKIQNHPFFMLPPLVSDNQSYTIVLVSSLPSSKYAYETSQVSFTANSSFVNLFLKFEPQLRTEEAEISNSTILGLFLFVVGVTCILNLETLQPIAYQAFNSYSYTTKTKKSPVAVPTDSPHIEPVSVHRRAKARKI